jgi:hypothetical protein
MKIVEPPDELVRAPTCDRLLADRLLAALTLPGTCNTDALSIAVPQVIHQAVPELLEQYRMAHSARMNVQAIVTAQEAQCHEVIAVAVATGLEGKLQQVPSYRCARSRTSRSTVFQLCTAISF